MSHYNQGPAQNSTVNERSAINLHDAARRRIKTAGNPIGIIDQSENHQSVRRSMGVTSGPSQAYGSFAPVSRSGVRTSAEATRRRRPPLVPSQQSSAYPGLSSANQGPFKWPKGSRESDAYAAAGR